MMWCGQAVAAVTVQVDRFNISENETVNLSIEISSDDSGEPQTDVLQKDFDILANNQSTSYSLINGSMNRKASWNIVLRPKRNGTLIIPAMKVGSATTRTISIQVSKEKTRSATGEQPSGDIWMDMEIEPKQVKVQQQAIITVRIYQAVSLNQGQLSEPKPTHAIIERLGEDATYQVTKNSRNWHVTERSYALFPQQSGLMEIEPLQLDGSILIGSGFYQSTKPIRIRSNSLSLNVEGIPDAWAHREWLPAKQLKLEESWPQSSEYIVGEPITRTLRISADGVTSSQLPALASELPDHLKAYPDKPALSDDKQKNGITGVRQEKIAIMPTRPGTYILPEIGLHWWNSETDQVEEVIIPARSFKVIADKAANMPAVTPKAPESSNSTETNPPLPPAQNGQHDSSWWRWLATFSSTGWLLTLAWLWRSRRKHAGTTPDAEKNRTLSRNEALKAVEQAVQSHDLKACEMALLQLAEAQNSSSPPKSLSSLVKQCHSEAAQDVLALEKAIYANIQTDWDGKTLLQTIKEGRFIKEPEINGDKQKALPGLYPD
ncbi:BatD family protein [Mariprofundus micogutta]|nr:BatD family protein [Mariprofundus micogutta]